MQNTLQKDMVLMFWLLLAFLLDVALIAGCSYVVFVLGRSPWWFALAVYLCHQPSLYKALRRRYGIPND